MLPDSQHGFAPVIHGIARGTAQVSVKQNGYDVYQTTVPPGPFTIDDINSAANGGDLQVTIKEADGSIQTLYVPYSSVPVLQRAGYTRYALAMGESGGIIAHADGITFGQPLGDTMVLVKAPGADNVKIENQTGIHTDWRGYAILPFATEYRENRVALNANSLADNVELDETVVTVIPTHGAIARATFNAQIGGKVLMTLKYGNKSVPFGAIVTHGENKNGSIVAENGQVYLTGLPQSGKLQVSWGNDKNSNCIVDYKLPEVSPGTLLNQQTAICR